MGSGRVWVDSVWVLGTGWVWACDSMSVGLYGAHGLHILRNPSQFLQWTQRNLRPYRRRSRTPNNFHYADIPLLYGTGTTVGGYLYYLTGTISVTGTVVLSTGVLPCITLAADSIVQQAIIGPSQHLANIVWLPSRYFLSYYNSN